MKNVARISFRRRNVTCPKMGSAADALVAPTTAKEFRFATHVYTVVQPFVCDILLDVFL